MASTRAKAQTWRVRVRRTTAIRVNPSERVTSAMMGSAPPTPLTPISSPSDETNRPANP